MINIIILIIIFLLILFFYFFILRIGKILEESISNKENNKKTIRILKKFKTGLALVVILVSSSLAFPINYGGILQQKFDGFINAISGYIYGFINQEDPQETDIPATEPTVEPTINPATEPTVEPTINPTTEPTVEPTINPTTEPTVEPTINPTTKPTVKPTINPVTAPTINPTTESTVFLPNLLGMDESMAISTCINLGFSYTIEYYLGGDGTVISQSPTSTEDIEPGGNVLINIGISETDFSNKLLILINNKRNSLGLGELSFSDQLNSACSILAQENVNSVDCTRPDGSHWSTVLFDNSIWLYDGIFTTRSNITSLSNTNGRIKYAGNKYGDGNLLTPSFNVIGMAYSSNNMLVIIVGSQ